MRSASPRYLEASVELVTLGARGCGREGDGCNGA